MTFIKKIGAGEMIPRWYGVAWADWSSDKAVCLPVGLNVIVAVMAEIWAAVKTPRCAPYVRASHAYSRGYADGWRAKGRF